MGVFLFVCLLSFFRYHRVIAVDFLKIKGLWLCADTLKGDKYIIVLQANLVSANVNCQTFMLLYSS